MPRRGNNWTNQRPSVVLGVTRVSKLFFIDNSRNTEWHDGTVVSRRRDGSHFIYFIRYDDEDTEEMYISQVRTHMKEYDELHNIR